MMAEETWLSASECLDYGFVDYIESNAMHAAACLPRVYHDFYKHVPDAVSAADGGDPKSMTSTVSDEKAKAIIEKANAVLEEYHYRKEHEKYAKHIQHPHAERRNRRQQNKRPHDAAQIGRHPHEGLRRHIQGSLLRDTAASGEQNAFAHLQSLQGFGSHTAGALQPL